MKQSLLAILLVISVVGYTQTNIIPTPSFQNISKEKRVITGSVLTVEEGVLSQAELRFLQMILAADGLQLETSQKDPDIRFSWRKHLLPEAYGIAIGEDIEIAFGSSTGAFYGMLSVLQMMEPKSGEMQFAKGIIEDAPAFQWRGLHLDVSRHFFTVTEVKEFLEFMALYKFNTFHWHLTDDQGWRIEIKQYPKLTEIGAFRDSTVIGHYRDTPRQYNHTRYGGFYTQEQVRDVVAFAKELHITVVPEIEMPGHSRAALAAYPELSCTGEQLGVPGLWGIFEDIYCANEASIQFLQNVLVEVLDMFPSEYIHIGGDEAPKTRWNESEVCQQVMRENGLKDAHELQSYFIKRMDTFLTERGRKLIGWDEILEGGLSPNSAVMSWRGEAGGIEAAKQKHNVVMSPTSYCYFDYYQSSHDSEPLAIGGYLPLEKVYEFNPIPKGLSKEEAKYILGGQANIWTEYIPTFEQVQYMAFPRALALIQGLWCQKKPDYATFLKAYLTYHEDFLKKMGVNRSMSIHIPRRTIKRTDNGVAYSWVGLDTQEVYKIQSSEEGVEGSTVELKGGEAIAFQKGRGDYDVALEYGQDEPIHFEVHRSDILGAAVEMISPPHRKYDHNGGLNLVDGIRGTIPWKGDQWLGFNKEEVTFVVALDSTAELKSYSIGFLQDNGSWIYLPEKVEVFVSEDKESWKSIHTHTMQTGTESINRETMTVYGKGKYVKFKIHPIEAIPEGSGGAGYIPWTFIDEIQIKIE